MVPLLLLRGACGLLFYIVSPFSRQIPPQLVARIDRAVPITGVGHGAKWGYAWSSDNQVEIARGWIETGKTAMTAGGPTALTRTLLVR